MTIALVTSTHEVLGLNGGTTATPIDTTGANFVAVVIADYPQVTASQPVTDNKGNTYTALTAQTVANSEGVRCRIFYCANATCGSGHTWTNSGSVLANVIAVYAFSGVATSSPLSNQNGATLGPLVGTITSMQAGSVAPTATDVFIFGCGWDGASGNGTAVDTGFSTPLIDNQVGGNNMGLLAAYKLSASSENPSATITSGAAPAGTNNAAAVLAAFKAPAAPAQLSITPPAADGLSTVAGTFTFAITNPNSGDTTVTPAATLSGTWQSPGTVTLNSGTLSATLTFTPTQQGPINTISATGNNSVLAASTVSYPVFSKLTVGTPSQKATEAQMIAVGLDEWPDGIVRAKAKGNGNFNFYCSNAGLSGGGSLSNEAKMVRWTGTLTDPTATGAGAHTTAVNIRSMKNALDYAAGGQILNLSDYGFAPLAMIYHGERWPSGGASKYWASLGMAISIDDGATWTDCGEIIYGSVAYNSSYNGTNAYEIGGGPNLLWSDGYFYVYYFDTVTPATYPGGYTFGCVARCSITDLVTALTARTVPTFYKYYAGSFSQLAITATSPPQGGSNDSVIGNTAKMQSWGDIAFHKDTNSIVMACWRGEEFGGANAIKIYQGFSPTQFCATPQEVTSASSGGTGGDMAYVGLWCDVSDGKTKISNANLYGTWMMTSGGNQFNEMWSATLAFDTTGIYRGGSQFSVNSRQRAKTRLGA